MNLLTQYKKSIKQLQENRELREDVKKVHQKIERERIEKIDGEISELQNKRYKLKRELEEKKERDLAAIDEIDNRELETINKVKKIYSYMDIIEKNERVREPEVYSMGEKIAEGKYKETPFKEVALVRDDKYSSINLYIVPNGKPKNCFSLYMVGISKLVTPGDYTNRQIFENGGIHGCNVHTRAKGSNRNWPDIQYVLKDDYSEKRLIEYMQKPNRKIKEILSVLNERAVEYEQTEELFKDVEWKRAYYEYTVEKLLREGYEEDSEKVINAKRKLNSLN